VKNKRRKIPANNLRGTGDYGGKVLKTLGFPLIMLVLSVSLTLFCYGALTHSDFFQITEIKIEGCKQISKSEILALSGVDVHSNIVKIDTGQIRALLEGHSWIKRAVISRELPDRLIISVEERVPVAMVNLDDGLYYVDRASQVFAPVDTANDLDYPVIIGLEGETLLEQTEFSVLDEALLFIKYASRQDNPNLPAQNISEINVGGNELVLFLMDRPFPIRLGRGGDMRVKYNRLVKVLYWLYKRKEFARVSYLDVDYGEGRVLVGMETG